MKKFLFLGICLAFFGCGGDENSKNIEKKPFKILFLLDWTPNTNHTGLYVAKDMGYFKDEGLDVEILPSGNDSTKEVVENGGANFAIGFMPSTIKAISKGKGKNIITIAAITQKNDSGFLYYKKAGINSPKDLVGKIYGGYDTKFDNAMIKSLINLDAKENLDPNLKFLNAYDEDIFTSFRSRHCDFAWASKNWQNQEVKINNWQDEFGFFTLIDYSKDYDFYSATIIANKEFLKKFPNESKKFLKALAKGYEFSAKNPEKSAQILLKNAPSLKKALVESSQNLISKNYLNNNGQWGIMDPKIWSNFSQFLLKHGAIDKIAKNEELFTNEYLQ